MNKRSKDLSPEEVEMLAPDGTMGHYRRSYLHRYPRLPLLCAFAPRRASRR
jgi:hypothetical protein